MHVSTSPAVAYGAAAISAAAWGLALGYGAGLLAWVAFVPLWEAWRRTTVPPKQVLTHVLGPSLLAYGGAFLVAYPWVGAHATASGTQAGLSALVILSTLYSLPLAAGARLALQGQYRTGIAVWAGSWMLVDLLLQHGSWAFPWALAAHAIVDSPGTYTLVRLGGPLAGTAAIGAFHAVCLATLRAFTLASAGTRRRLAVGAGLVLALLGLLLIQDRSSLPSSASVQKPASVSWVVQPDVAPAAWAEARNPLRKERLAALTQAALDTASVRPDLVVWPETALHPPDTVGMQATVDRWGAAVLTGAVLPAGASHARHYQTNTALLYRPRHSVQRYDKHHLVPFAEAVPGASSWQALQRLAMASPDSRAYVPGSGPTTFSHDAFSFVPLICFESLAAPFTAQLGSDMPTTQAFITLSQTGWWGRALPAQQHVRYSRLRAMETGRPLLVASVSGPTTLIGPLGTPTALTPFGEAAVVPVHWPAPHPPGWYARTAPYIDIAWTAIALFLVCVPIRQLF